MNLTDHQHPDAFLIAVYEMLIKIGGAHEDLQTLFIQSHNDSMPCNEWRFVGNLGYGGKYWRCQNQVTFYREDQSIERDAIAAILNIELRVLADKSGKSFPTH